MNAPEECSVFRDLETGTLSLAASIAGEVTVVGVGFRERMAFAPQWVHLKRAKSVS